jgi:hypothetical protein
VDLSDSTDYRKEFLTFTWYEHRRLLSDEERGTPCAP